MVDPLVEKPSLPLPDHLRAESDQLLVVQDCQEAFCDVQLARMRIRKVEDRNIADHIRNEDSRLDANDALRIRQSEHLRLIHVQCIKHCQTVEQVVLASWTRQRKNLSKVLKFAVKGLDCELAESEDTIGQPREIRYCKLVSVDVCQLENFDRLP